MKKKLIAMLLTLTMLASLLAGCGSGNAVSKGSDSSEPAQNSEAQSDSTEVDLSEKITVSIFQQADDVTMEEYLSNPVLLYWQDKTFHRPICTDDLPSFVVLCYAK